MNVYIIILSVIWIANNWICCICNMVKLVYLIIYWVYLLYFIILILTFNLLIIIFIGVILCNSRIYLISFQCFIRDILLYGVISLHGQWGYWLFEILLYCTLCCLLGSFNSTTWILSWDISEDLAIVYACIQRNDLGLRLRFLLRSTHYIW